MGSWHSQAGRPGQGEGSSRLPFSLHTILQTIHSDCTGALQPENMWKQDLLLTESKLLRSELVHKRHMPVPLDIAQVEQTDPL